MNEEKMNNEIKKWTKSIFISMLGAAFIGIIALYNPEYSFQTAAIIGTITYFGMLNLLK